MLRLTWHSEPSTMNKLYTNRTGRTRLGKRRVHPWRVKRKRRVQAFTCNIDPSHTLLHCRQLREDVKCISVLHAHVTCANQLFLVFLQCRYPHALSRPWGWVEDGWCCFGLVWGWFVGVKLARVQLIKLWRGFRKLVAFSSKDHICGQQQELVHDENHLRTNRSIVLSCVVFELFQIHVLYCAVGGWPYKNSPTIFAANTDKFFFPDYYISLFIRTHSRPGGRKFAFFDTQGLGFPRPTRTVDGGAGLVAYGIWTHMVAVDDVCQDKQVGLQH